MLEKYRLYMNIPGWGISKRFLLFFRRRMTYTKVVRYENGGSASSRELLIFDNMNMAVSERNWLRNTGMELKSRVWKNGKLEEFHRQEPIMMTIRHTIRSIRKLAKGKTT